MKTEIIFNKQPTDNTVYKEKVFDVVLSGGSPQGLSAYQLAVKNGFQGTEQEWLESLIGPAVQLRVTETAFEWKYADEEEWQELIQISDLNYEEFSNLPEINNVKLIGNLTPADLGLSSDSEGVASIVRDGLVYTVTRPDGSVFTFNQLDQENVIESVSVNGTQLAVNNKNVDIAVPTAVSELTNDSNYATQSYVDTSISNHPDNFDLSDRMAKGVDDNEEVVAGAIVEGEISGTYKNKASGNYSHAEGAGTTASGSNSHAEGGGAKATGYSSHAEGAGTTASGGVSHAEGGGTIASGYSSHAEGQGATASGNNSHAEGAGTTASGTNSHAEGGDTTASGSNSHAEGQSTIANHAYQHTFGEYNVADTSTAAATQRGTYVEIVGNGRNSSNRSNARTLDWNGNEILAGKLTVGAAPTENMDVATKKYVDDGLSNIDLSNYTTQTYVDTELAKKQDTLSIDTPTSADIGKALMPKTVENGVVTSWEFGEAGMVDDVVIDGVSIVNNKIANIPIATANNLGVVKVDSGYGVSIYSNNKLTTSPASISNIKPGTEVWKPIVPYWQHASTFYGLAKAAGDTTQSASSNAVGTYTNSAKTAIQSMLGIDTAIANAVGQITGFDFSIVQELPVSGVKGVIYLVAHSHGDNDGYDEYIWINNGFEKLGHCDIDLTDYATIDYVDNELENKVDDVQVNGASIVSGGVAEIPPLTSSSLGVTKPNNTYGTQALSGGAIGVLASTSEQVKTGTNAYRPIVPNHQHESTFYGLAKAAGDSTQSVSANAVGTYTDDAKTAIQTMLGVPADDEVVKDVQINGTSIVSNGAANIPIASANDLGTVKIGAGGGISILSDGSIGVSPATESAIKFGQSSTGSIVPSRQHQSIFYGLAKAAGDTTQSQSDNAVGTYTTEAKTAIQTMLGIPDTITAELADYEESSSTITNAQIDALFI